MGGILFQRWAIVSAIDHYRSKNLLSLSIALNLKKAIVIDSRKQAKICKKGPKWNKNGTRKQQTETQLNQLWDRNGTKSNHKLCLLLIGHGWPEYHYRAGAPNIQYYPTCGPLCCLASWQILPVPSCRQVKDGRPTAAARASRAQRGICYAYQLASRP